MSGWIFLAAAIALECVGTTFMKLSNGFQKPLYGGMMLAFYIASFVALSFALKEIPVSVAYAIWGGVGIALITFVGLFFFSESMTLLKTAGIVLIIAGVVALNLGGSH